MVDTKKLVFLYLVLFPFGQLLRFQLTENAVLHPTDLLAGLIALSWFTNRKLPSLARPLLAFGILAFFSLLFAATKHSLNEVFVGALYLLRFLAYVFFYFAIWGLVQAKKLPKLPDFLIIVGASFAIFGWVQYFLFPDLRPLLAYGWDEHYFRLAGGFLDPGFTGILLTFFTLLVFTKDWGREGQGKAAFLALLGIAGVAATFSRASFIAFFAGLTALYIVRRNLRVFLGALAIFLATLWLLPKPGGEGVNLGRQSTVWARFENAKQALSLFSDSPLLGTGYNLYRFEAEKAGFTSGKHAGSGVDSSFLFVLATVGVPGLLSFLWIWWEILKMGWQKRRTQVGLVVFVSALALLVHSLFTNSLFYPWVMGWMFLLLASYGE